MGKELSRNRREACKEREARPRPRHVGAFAGKTRYFFILASLCVVHGGSLRAECGNDGRDQCRDADAYREQLRQLSRQVGVVNDSVRTVATVLSRFQGDRKSVV